MKPLVSVIIPVLNRKDLLLRCLASVEAQTYRPLEVIIADNGSTDGTLAGAEEWGAAHSTPGFAIKTVEESKPGACAARNRALKEATGEYILHFDSDDTMRPQLASSAMAEFEKNPAIDIVCWPCLLHLLDGTEKRPTFNPGKAMEDHLINSLLRTQGYMIRSHFLHEAGGWDESLPGWNDWELGVRILGKRPNLASIPDVLVDIYSQANSITGTGFSSKAGRWEKSLKAVREDIEKSTLPDKDRLLRIVSYREIILAAHYAREGNTTVARHLRDKTIATLKNDVPTLTRHLHAALLSFAYHYTRHGGRGAWRLIGKLL